MLNIENFLNTMNGDMRKMVDTDGLQYLSFSVMSSMIEFLGACFDTEDFFVEGESENRFRRAIDELDAFSAYRKYNKKDVQYDIYKNLRCGMVRILKTGKEIALTELSDEDKGDNHLKICTLDDTATNSRLILVCEHLLRDIDKAIMELIGKMKQPDWTGKSYSKDFMNPSLDILECE